MKVIQELKTIKRDYECRYQIRDFGRVVDFKLIWTDGTLSEGLSILHTKFIETKNTIESFLDLEGRRTKFF